MANETTKALRAAGLAAAEAQGYTIARYKSGKRGALEVYDLTKDGVTTRTALRTTTDDWVALIPREDGDSFTFAPIDEHNVEAVLIVRLARSPNDLHRAQVWMVPAADMRAKFAEAAHTLKDNGLVVVSKNKDGEPIEAGMWRYLFKMPDSAGYAQKVGSGIVEGYKMIADEPLDLSEEALAALRDIPIVEAPDHGNAGDWMDDLRDLVAQQIGIDPSRVEVSVRIR